MPSHLRQFPEPLLEDIIRSRCIPFVGAGFSLNAECPPEKKMPLWDKLGKDLAAKIPDFDFRGPLDAISAFEHTFSRPVLIENLSKLLLVDEAKPGKAHQAFAKLQFDIAATTNVEFLLESAYQAVGRTCRPIIDEDQLSSKLGETFPDLLKLHGDLNHPRRLVMTEDDYDVFISKNPVLATFLGNLLISRTPLFIGYSLEDPDFRQIWQVIGERLGKLRRLAYTIQLNAKPHEIARFERRGVRVINYVLPKYNYAKLFEELFDELREHWNTKTAESNAKVEKDYLAELALPNNARSRLCLVLAPYQTLGFYRANIFPLIEKHGFNAVSPEDLLIPGESTAAKVSALVSRAELVILDISTRYTMMEAGIVLSQRKPDERLFVVMEQGTDLPHEMLSRVNVIRSSKKDGNSQLIRNIDDWLVKATSELEDSLRNEPRRLLEKNEHRAAIISAVALLETTLRSRLYQATDVAPWRTPINQLLRTAAKHQIVDASAVERLLPVIELRNKATHTGQHISRDVAEHAVEAVYNVL